MIKIQPDIPSMCPTSRSLHVGKPSMYPTSRSLTKGMASAVTKGDRESHTTA